MTTRPNVPNWHKGTSRHDPSRIDTSLATRYGSGVLDNPQKYCGKLWSPCHRRCVKIILDEISINFPLLWLPSHQFELDMWRWLVSESGTENTLASDSSSESPRPWWFFMANKDSSQCFGSAHQSTQLLDGFFARTELLALVGVASLFLVGQKRGWGKTRSSSVVFLDFCSLPVQAHRCRTVSSSLH